MCVHMQNLLSLGSPISSHRRVVIFLVWVCRVCVVRFFPTRPCREASERVEASYL